MKNYNKYNTTRLLSILFGLIPTFLSYFTSRDKNFIVLNSFFNTSFNENTKEFFLYLIKNTNYKVRFVINDDNLREKLIQEYGNYFIETNTFKGKMEALKAHTWLISSFAMPVGGLFLKFRRNVIHLQHGVSIKNIGLAEKNLKLIKKIYYAIIKTNLSYTLIPSTATLEFTKKFLNIKEEKILISGYPRYDLILKNKNKVKKDNTIKILYAPTWRHFADVKIFPFNDFDIYQLDEFCKKNNIEIYLRLHPMFERKIDPNLFKVECIKSYSSKIEKDINNSLYQFDMLITDYSSIFYDFFILNRPTFFFDYDIEEYEQEVGFAVDYKNVAIGYRQKTMAEFIENINDALNFDKFKEKREYISQKFNGSFENNSKQLLKDLINKNILNG